MCFTLYLVALKQKFRDSQNKTKSFEEVEGKFDFFFRMSFGHFKISLDFKYENSA